MVWLLLLTMPFWLNSVGGYTALGSRVLVLALAAMSLNFLLGFTGVLSFGHAAYFGLGAYGTGPDDQVSGPEHARRHAVGVVAGAVAAAVIGPLIVRLRGDLFRDGARSPSAKCSISSPFAGTRSPAATTGCPAGIACRSISALPRSTSSTTTRRSITSC